MWQIEHRNENNQLHCTDGPALQHRKGGIVYYLEGRRFDDFDEWCKEARISNQKAVLIKLKYGTRLIRYCN